MAKQNAQLFVFCKRCDVAVPITSAERPPTEFAIKCPNCGRRDFYQPSDIKITR